LIKPDLMIGQTYVDGRWSVEPERLFKFLNFLRSQEHSALQSWFLISNRFHFFRDAVKQRFFPIRSTRAVVEHYNTDPVFMSLILGPSLSYTCAFFDEVHVSLDDAQSNKLDLIARRLDLSANHRLLELGVGWGYAAFPFAERLGCSVTGITISQAQVDFCDQKRRRSSAKDRLSFLCTDYAKFSPVMPFDRVLSIGMLEHVGKYQYTSFFDKLSEFLNKDGLGLIHSMVDETETSPDAWIDRNIFPGGYIPTMPEVIEGIDRSKCELIQVFIHEKRNYFKTLDMWKGNLFRLRSQCASRLKEIGVSESDANKIIRIWEYFLSSSQLAFSPKLGRCKVAQFLVRKRTDGP
jgi:cyclopropane-fatty-acyl-phospholipid synthase